MSTHTTDIGQEKVCSKCGESFPLDRDFFFSNGVNAKGVRRFTSACKACYVELYRKPKKGGAA